MQSYIDYAQVLVVINKFNRVIVDMVCADTLVSYIQTSCQQFSYKDFFMTQSMHANRHYCYYIPFMLGANTRMSSRDIK